MKKRDDSKSGNEGEYPFRGFTTLSTHNAGEFILKGFTRSVLSRFVFTLNS